MSRSSILMIMGVLIMIISFAGFPLVWVHLILPVLGFVVAVIGFLIRADHVASLRHDAPRTLSESANEVSSIA